MTTLGALAVDEPSAIKIGPFGSQLKKVDLVGSGIHVVGIENVIANKFDGLGNRFITSEKFEALRSFEVRPGDLVITMMGTIGKVTLVPEGTSTSIMDSHLLRFRPNPHLCVPEFVAWLIKGSPSIRRAIEAKAHGAIMKGLNSSLIRALQVPLPPLLEQKRIVKLLDEADRLRKLRAEADARSITLIPALFHEMFGDPEHTKVPVKSLGELVNPERPITYGILKPGPNVINGIPYVRVIDIKQNRLHYHQLHRTTPTIAEEYRRSTLRPGDILISIRGTVGRTCIVPDELGGANITQDTARLAVSPTMDRHYVVEFLNTPWAQGWMKRHVLGQAVKGINLGDLRKLPIPVAPLPRQKEFAANVRRVQHWEELHSKSREHIDALFQSMLHLAFVGEL